MAGIAKRTGRAWLQSLLTLAALCLACGTSVHASAGTGFLVVAPDRGFLGNQELRVVFDEFTRTYSPARLVFVGRDYQGAGSQYADYLHSALIELREAGAAELLAIPFFLTDADPILQRVKSSISAYDHPGAIRWAAAMTDSYLIAQVVLDRAAELSRDPDHEQVIVVGSGATTAANERSMHDALRKVVAYLSRYRSFRDVQTVIYYDQAVPGAEEENQAADAVVTRMAARKGRTLAVLAMLGPKFDHMMALSSSLKRKFSDIDVVFSHDEIVPHPNVMRWLKKTANAYVPATPDQIGIIIMPHGANQIWNDAVDRVVAPLRSKYRIEMAYGMGDPDIIQEAVARLEARDVRRIVFVRMYALARHMQARTDYILGLSDALLSKAQSAGHGAHSTPPPQIRSAAVFASFGGYEESPLITDILHERIVEVSREPAKETVILVAHGEKTDEGNAAWLSIMRTHVERLKAEPHCAQLKAIHAATVREDWPEEREKAVNDVRRVIQDASQNGRVLVIADRLYGAGPYRTLFEGLDYTLNDKGLAHPLLTQWLETGIAKSVSVLAQPQPVADPEVGR